MNPTLSLLKYFVHREFRESHHLWSLLLFAMTAVYACYRIAVGSVDVRAWVTLHWVVVLFSAFNAASRVHADDAPEVRAWMRGWVGPRPWAAARALYATLVLLAVTTVVFLAFAVLLPAAFLEGAVLVWMAGMGATSGPLPPCFRWFLTWPCVPVVASA